MKIQSLSQFDKKEKLEIILDKLPEKVRITDYALVKGFKVNELVKKIHHSSYEWYGFLIGERSNPGLVTDIGIGKNDANNSAYTRIAPEEIQKFLEEMNGNRLINGWIHSHGNLGFRQFSGTDDGNMKTVLSFVASATRKPIAKKEIIVNDISIVTEDYTKSELKKGTLTLITNKKIEKPKILETVYGGFSYSIVIGDEGWHEQEISCEKYSLFTDKKENTSEKSDLEVIATGKTLSKEDVNALQKDVKEKIRPVTWSWVNRFVWSSKLKRVVQIPVKERADSSLYSERYYPAYSSELGDSNQTGNLESKIGEGDSVLTNVKIESTEKNVTISYGSSGKVIRDLGNGECTVLFPGLTYHDGKGPVEYDLSKTDLRKINETEPEEQEKKFKRGDCIRTNEEIKYKGGKIIIKEKTEGRVIKDKGEVCVVRFPGMPGKYKIKSAHLSEVSENAQKPSNGHAKQGTLELKIGDNGKSDAEKCTLSAPENGAAQKEFSVDDTVVVNKDIRVCGGFYTVGKGSEGKIILHMGDIKGKDIYNVRLSKQCENGECKPCDGKPRVYPIDSSSIDLKQAKNREGGQLTLVKGPATILEQIKRDKGNANTRANANLDLRKYIQTGMTGPHGKPVIISRFEPDEFRGLNWEKTHEKLKENNLFMPTPALFMHYFKNVVNAWKGGAKLHDSLGNEINNNELADIYFHLTTDHIEKGACTWLDAYFEEQKDGFYILTENKAKKEKLENNIMGGCYVELEFNRQGMPIKKSVNKNYTRGKNIYYWQPEDGYVAGFIASSNRTDLDCYQDSKADDNFHKTFACAENFNDNKTKQINIEA
ncbi:MAG: hypothetical protein WC475_04155 [Candidatus Paceibacterota bacterium]